MSNQCRWIRQDTGHWEELSDPPRWRITFGKVTLHDGRPGPSVVILWDLDQDCIDSIHDIPREAHDRAEVARGE